MTRTARIIVSGGLLLALAMLGPGCSESTAPVADGGNLGRADASGLYDPAAGSFVLQTLEQPPPGDGRPVRIQLIGSNLSVDSAEEMVSLDVAIRSLHPEPLYAPAVVWVERFEPAEVVVANADFVLVPPAASTQDSFAWFQRFGFDYSGLLGDDGVLEPGETSASRTWIFQDPGLVSFSFAGWAEFGLAPDLPRIAGRCFLDENADGRPAPDEPPLGSAVVLATLPGGEMVTVSPGPDGRYSLPVEAPGLYSLRCELPWASPPGPCFTTPNPREVLLTPGPDGVPRSFLEAHFGLCPHPGPLPPPIRFTDLPPGELRFGNWTLIEAEVAGRLLRLHVGYSGCEPDHPFALYASGGFMESQPPQINVVLVHELVEACDAYFEQDLLFDLGPLWHAFLESYGPGVLILDLITFYGDVHQVEFPVFPDDDGGID